MNEPENQPHVVEDLVEPVNRYVHNSIAAAIVKFLKRTPVTPNQVTYASIFIGLISAYRFSLGTRNFPCSSDKCRKSLFGFRHIPFE